MRNHEILKVMEDIEIIMLREICKTRRIQADSEKAFPYKYL